MSPTAATCKSVMIEIDLLGYWHAGTGRGGGEDIDALCDKDHRGLPRLRGRRLKGVVRDEGADRLVAWSVLTPTDRDLLFGRKAVPKGPGSLPGCLGFSDARLPANVAVVANGNRKLTGDLYRRIASTRIEHSTGTARDKSLHSIEAAIPLKLYATVTWDPLQRLLLEKRKGTGNVDASEAISRLGELDANWKTLLDECLTYIEALGANKTRGFGRARLRILS